MEGKAPSAFNGSEGPAGFGGWAPACPFWVCPARPRLSPVSLPAEEFQALLRRLPDDRFLNCTAIAQFWATDSSLQHRYQQLGDSLSALLKKTQRVVRRLFNLCKRCHRQPRFRLPKAR